MTNRNLTIWVAATMGKNINGIEASKTLLDHKFSGVTTISQAQLNLIIGDSAVVGSTNFQSAIATIETNVKANTALNTDKLLTNQNLSALQWATGTLLNND